MPNDRALSAFEKRFPTGNNKKRAVEAARLKSKMNVLFGQLQERCILMSSGADLNRKAEKYFL